MSKSPTNSKRWQESSDGWVTAMNKSKEKKALKKKDICDHGDLEWCEVCMYDEDGNKYDI